MKLKDMVELLSNNDACVVLKVKDGQEMNLISLGCFNGDEVMMRLTKGRDVTCTLFRKNGKSLRGVARSDGLQFRVRLRRTSSR